MKTSPTTLAAFLALAAVVPAAAAAQTGEALTKWEKLEPNEEESARKVGLELIEQVRTDFVKDGKRAFRDAHPRGIGCVAAEFTINPNLPAAYQTGLFSKPGQKFDAIIRYSSSLGPAGDNVPDARGMAIKVLGVPGKKLSPDQADALTHDFLQIDAPIFPTKNSEEFAGLVAAKTNPLSLPGFLIKKPILRALELKSFLELSSGNPNNGKSLAERQYFSQVPYLLKGPNVNTPVKFSSRPCAPVESRALDGGPGELRNDLQQRLNEGELCFDFMLQFYKEGVGFEVENGMSEWKESSSPFVKFAKVIIPKQRFLTDEKLHYCDSLSMAPWHALPEHRPLGNLNRVRKIVYEMLSDFRHSQNKEDDRRKEPTDLSQWNSFVSSEYNVWDAVKIPAGN